MEQNFEWSLEKEKKNIQKHQLDFHEASTIFDDSMLITFLDSEHSLLEERYISIGLSNKQRLLMVAHTERNDNIRIISARKATANEERFYKETG